MMRTLFVAFAIFALAFAAAGCAPAKTGTPSPEPGAETPSPDEPISSDQPTPTPAEEQPAPAGGGYEYGEAPVDSFDIVFLESFPLQVNVIVTGNLPDGCTEIDEVTSKREGDTFVVRLTTRRPVDQMCTEALVPYEEVVSLDVYGLPAGTYTVDVNGMTGMFTLETDNVLPDEPSAGEFIYALAQVTDIEIFEPTGPGATRVIIRGYLPDACTDIHSFDERLEGSTIHVTVETSRPADAICAQMIEEFEVTYELTRVPGPGTYIVNVNGVEAQFTVQ